MEQRFPKFQPSGGWSHWKTRTVDLSFRAGESVRLRLVAGDQPGPALDQIHISVDFLNYYSGYPSMIARSLFALFFFQCQLQLVEAAGTVKVFILAGQSNMEGQGVVDLDHPKYYNGGRAYL